MLKNFDKLNLAKKYFELQNYNEAYKLFEELDAVYEMGFSKLLLGESNEAKIIWENSKNPCSATYWGLTILDIIELKYKDIPTYFQIRAFLEVYLNLFILNSHYVWAENILSAWEVFSRVNYETCKFIARVLFYHNYNELTLDFIKKSKDICPNDPEALFIEAQCNLKMNNERAAKKSLDYLLDIVPEYLPAKELIKKIKN